MKKDIEITKKINLDSLTKSIEEKFPKISVVIETNDETKERKIIVDDTGLTKEQKQEIEQIIENHNPEFSDEELMIKNQQENFDNQVKESLLRLGFTLPKK